MQSPMRPPHERGMALMVVLLLTMVLVPFAAQFAYQINLEAITARNVKDELMIDLAVEGQYQIMLGRLRHDGRGNETDSLDEDWNNEEALERTDEETQVKLRTTIWDEQGKFPLVALVQGNAERRAIWKTRLAELIRIYRQDTDWDASAIADDLAEEIFRYISGSGNRNGVPMPATINDAKMLILDELTFVHQAIREHKMLEDVQKEEETAPGLHRYLTIFGNGKINLNTADRVVLRAMFPQNPEIADDIIERREGTPEDEEGELTSEEDEDEEAGGNPFTNPNQVNELESVTQEVLKANNVVLANDFVVKSDIFSMRIRGTTKNTARAELAVVERVPGKDPKGPIQGFRHLLFQERIDALVELQTQDDGY